MPPVEKLAPRTIPEAAAPLSNDLQEVLQDALDSRHKSGDTYREDLADAFAQVPQETIAHAAALCRELGNEAMKKERWDEAVEHYTSVLAAYPQDYEVLGNRSLAYLNMREGHKAMLDAATAVNLKPSYTKGFYRLGCALEECKMYKESAAIFAKVVEMEPSNAEASGRLFKARSMLEMVMNVERVNDPLWMHKPAPPKSEIQTRAEEAQALNDKQVNALREEMGKASFDFDYLFTHMSVDDKWYSSSMLAKGVNAHLVAHSAVLAPQAELARLMDSAHVDAFAEAIRAHVPALVPNGQAGVVLLYGSTMGLLPVLAMEAGANKVYVVEPHGFNAKLAHASVGRHTLLAFEKENWSRLPMSLGLAERTKQAGSAALKLGKYDQAVALYTEALQTADSLDPQGNLKSTLLCNRSLAYLKMQEPESALQDAEAAQKCQPENPKGYYRAAQAHVDLGYNGKAVAALQQVLRCSKKGKNADAERMLEQLKDAPPIAARQTPRADGASKPRPRAREDRAQRLSVAEVNEAIQARADKVKTVHGAFDKLRLHHELQHKPDLVVATNFDFSLLGKGLVTALNNLKSEQLLRREAMVLPSAARVWAMAVEVSTDTGVPVHMEAIERLFWSPALRQIDMDAAFYRRVVKPLSHPVVAFCFDFRAEAPPIKPSSATLRFTVTAEGKANAVVFWFEMPLGAAGVISTAPAAALPPNASRFALGQALQFMPPARVRAKEQLLVEARHSRTRLVFSWPSPPNEPPRRGLVLGSQLRRVQDSHYNRTFAAAVRKALFRLDGASPALVLHVGAGVGTQAVVAAAARPQIDDFVVACERSATMIDVAQRAARDNSVGERISFVQKDCRNLKAHEDLPRKADVLLLECLDTSLLSEGILHYLQHLRGPFTKPNATIIPAAAVVKGMLVELRSGEVHGVDMTMSDAYRWHKEVQPARLKEDDFVQLSEVFDMFVFDFNEAVVEQQVEHLEVIISRDGIVSAVVFWFDLILDEEIVISTSPFVPEPQQLEMGQGVVYLQPAETRVKRGATVPLLAAHNGTDFAFTLEEEKLTRKGADCQLLAHTRFDPRWEGARANLEDQWKKILQSIGSNPKECKQMQEVVMRYAAQPAVFGIDIGVSERCAMTFLSD